MPLYWTIDSKERLFTGIGEGEVTLDDAMSFLEALAGAKALSYRKLFDGRAVQSRMTGDDILASSVPRSEPIMSKGLSAHLRLWLPTNNSRRLAACWARSRQPTGHQNIHQSATGAYLAGLTETMRPYRLACRQLISTTRPRPATQGVK
jgi:hypothetical protein